MFQRIEVARTESETALFYDLLIGGELVAKLVVAGLASPDYLMEIEAIAVVEYEGIKRGHWRMAHWNAAGMEAC